MTIEPRPTDYEQCGECGFDHEYETAEAITWHKDHPCSYCNYDKTKGTHEPTCPTQQIVRAGMIMTEAKTLCSECYRPVKKGYAKCYGCFRNSRRR